MVSDGDHFFACVPWFARYAYEVHVLPRRPVTSLLDLDDDECRSLGLVLRDVVRRYDALWGLRMPYVLAVHQAPVGDHPHYPFHVELHPPLRAPGLTEVSGRARDRWRVDDERVRSRREGGGAPWRTPLTTPRRLLCELGDHIRDAVVGARGMDMAVIEGETVADTIYAIDRVADDTLLQWFEEHWTGVEVVSEGLDEPVVVGTDPTVDGHRRHHRRHARVDVRQAAGVVPGGRRAARRLAA